MHEPVLHACIFGCRGEQDELRHYLTCSPLWQIAGQALEVEVPIVIGERLCIMNPFPPRIRLLALCFSLNQNAKSHFCQAGSELAVTSREVQRFTWEAARTLKDHV